MNYYFYKLIPPRKTFATDMTSAEAAIMAKHSDYWKALIGFGQALVAGPVDDPHGSYGVGIVSVADDVAANSLGNNDPAILAEVGFKFEVHRMPSILLPEAK